MLPAEKALFLFIHLFIDLFIYVLHSPSGGKRVTRNLRFTLASREPRYQSFSLVKLGVAGKDPGIGWSHAQQTPKNLGCNKLAMNR